MDFHIFYHAVHSAIITHFDEVDEWFDKPKEIRCYKPTNGGWSINEILEHIMLTNHFLLKLIDKGKNKALKKEDNRKQKNSFRDSDGDF